MLFKRPGTTRVHTRKMFLTTKGHIASCINGYDKVVLTELITGSYMTELSVCELGVLLSFFIKFSGDVELYEIEHICYLYDYLVSMDATVYISFAPLVYQWLERRKVWSHRRRRLLFRGEFHYANEPFGTAC